MDKGNNGHPQIGDTSSIYGNIFDEELEPTNTIEDNNTPPAVVDTTLDQFKDVAKDSPDILEEILKAKNIDMNSIKFENEEGVLEERKWSELSLEEQKNIIISNDLDNDYGLEDDEVSIINNLRESKLSYEDYIANIKNQAIEEYVKNNNPYQVYSVDEYSDDELYLLDLKTRTPDLTDDELIMALENEKNNDVLYGKKTTALRNEYKQLEVEKIKAEEELEEQENLRSVEEFENTIKNTVTSLDSIGSLQLSTDEKNKIYNFITGTNAAGERMISAALNDPDQLVKMAWFNLYGEQGFDVIKDYFVKELANSRKEIKASGDKSTVIHVPKENINTNKPEDKQIKSINSLYNLD